MLEFKDLLSKHQLDPKAVLLLRHTPTPPRLKKALPLLAENHPVVFNAYQQTQFEIVEKKMMKASHVASFIGRDDGTTVFAGLYERHGQKLKTPEQIISLPPFDKLKSYGVDFERRDQYLFDLRVCEDFYRHWKGKLTIDWPGGKINYHRWASTSGFRILAVHEESVFVQKPSTNYRDWDLRWEELEDLPQSWKALLSGWRGIYYIFDVSDGKGYVGKASGSENLFGRWKEYKKSGDGGNKKLLGRDPRNFRFSILEHVPDDIDDEVIEQREQNWMLRLRTRSRTHGLNSPEQDY